jgi:fatty acid desaturase
VSRHSGDHPPQDRPSEVPARTPRRKRVVLNDSRHPVTVVKVITEVEEQTSVGEALVRNLIRAQRRLALGLAAVTAVLFGSLPLLFYLVPAFATASLFGVRLPWLLLGVLPFPVLFGIGLLYNRLAERHEKDFVNMVEG